MANILTITAASAAGKDSILKSVLQQHKDVLPVVSVTTRPPRDNEVEGVDYHFVSHKDFERMIFNNELLEYRSYDTEEGTWLYGTPKSSIDFKSCNTYICVLDVEGVKNLKECLEEWEGVEVITIYIDCNSKTRLIRSLDRNSNKKDSQIAEICRRFLADMEEIIPFKNQFDIMIRNEELEDFERCVKRIGIIIEHFKNIK